MEFSPALQGASVSLQTREGLPYLLVQGRQPVQDTFLDLILQAQWSGGKLKRNYALLLNSMASNRPRAAAPVAATQLPVAAATPVQTTTATAAPEPSVNADDVPVYKFNTPAAPSANESIATSPAPAVQGNTTTTAHRGPVAVNTGDTASEIAVRNLPESVSLDQMLVAMAKANPNAFIEGNVNLVRAGSSLRMPSANEAQQTSRQEASQIVMAHTRDFVAYTQRLARTPVQVDQTSTSEMSGRLSTPDTSVKNAESKPDRLTLSQATVSTEQEAKIAKAQEGKDKQQELDALQKNMAELQELAKNKDAGPGVGVNLPQPENTAPAQATQPAENGSLLEKLQKDPRTVGWATALLAAMLALAWWVRRSQKRANPGGMAYSPSYDDVPATANTAPDLTPEQPPMAAAMPAGLSNLDLDLNSPPSAPVPPSVAPIVVAPAAAPSQPADTGANKLQLAQQLLQQGEKDLARALLLSAIKSNNASVQTQALQLLNTLQ
jgi:pilus assembly protein FimV